MENNDRRQRQSNPTGYTTQQGLLQQSPQYPPASAPDRYRQATLQQSPTSAPSNRRAGSQTYGAYGYGEGAQFVGSSMQAGTIQYQPEYTSDSTRSQQQPQYSQYGSNIMYNVPGQQQGASPASPYDSVQPYAQQPRQSAAVEVLATQFGVPQQYYVPGAGDTGPTSAPNTAIAQQNVPSQYPSLSYTQQSPVAHAREPIASAYGAAMTDTSAQGTTSQYGTQGYSAQSGSEFDAAYQQYQGELRRTNENVRDGRLAEAGSSLVRVSEWLLGNAESLVRDEEAMHDERLRLWEEFNYCWLAALQRQKDLTVEMHKTGQPPQAPQTLMEVEFLKNMGNELVRLCDIMEKHGLVDYQMGVWEESIMDLLMQCLDLLDDQNTVASSSGRRR
ncbi:hypothetical protein NA57DRAFT_70368 [Rhizodiscina lignyota]|uniref:Uncharacterized protein n=1 Tax=Rhizodiscina lignyota TaxID=1504668 RepID=A0A9P4MBA5_9PEZI|nr:hypothetical protein NA57DRAFT_70368 [Rhizodiscina lignyota]